MSDATVAALERELAVFVRRARAASERMSRQVHPELDAYAYGLLARLADQGPQRSIDLAEHVGVGKATITRQLKPLEALGLIRRLPDPADGRAHLVALTPDGERRVTHECGNGIQAIVIEPATHSVRPGRPIAPRPRESLMQLA